MRGRAVIGHLKEAVEAEVLLFFCIRCQNIAVRIQAHAFDHVVLLPQRCPDRPSGIAIISQNTRRRVCVSVRVRCAQYRAAGIFFIYADAVQAVDIPGLVCMRGLPFRRLHDRAPAYDVAVFSIQDDHFFPCEKQQSGSVSPKCQNSFIRSSELLVPKHFTICEADHSHVIENLIVKDKPVLSAAGHIAVGGAKKIVGRNRIEHSILNQVADAHLASCGDHCHVSGVIRDGIIEHSPGLRRIGSDTSEVHHLCSLVSSDRPGQRVDRLRHDRPLPVLVGQRRQGELSGQHIVVYAQGFLRRRGQILALVDQRLPVIVLNIDITPYKIGRQCRREGTRCSRNAHPALSHLLAQIRVPAADQDSCKPGKFLISRPVPVDPVVAAERFQPGLDRDVIAVLVLNSDRLLAENIRHDFVGIALCEHGQNMVLIVALQKELDLLHAPDRLDIARRTDADQVFTAADRVFDIIIEIACGRQLVLVAKNSSDRLDPQLLADAPRDDISLDPVLDLRGHFGVQLRVPV